MGRINLCVSDSYSRLTAQRTGGLPRAHLFVLRLHFTLTRAAGPRFMSLRPRVCFKTQAGVCFPLHLVESNLSPGRAHKSRWGMGMNSARVKESLTLFTDVPVVGGWEFICFRINILFRASRLHKNQEVKVVVRTAETQHF